MNKEILLKYLSLLAEQEDLIVQAKYNCYELKGKLEAELADEDRSRLQLTISSELNANIKRLLNSLNSNFSELNKLSEDAKG